MTSRNSDTMRAGDGDRHRVVEVLRTALDEGRLTLSEFDERVATAYAALTYADLNVLLEDLPQAPEGILVVPKPRAAARVGPPPEPATPHRMPTALMVLWTIWGSVVAVNVAVWLIVSLTAHFVYPWPLWVAGPSGAALLGVTVGVQRIRRHRNLS